MRGRYFLSFFSFEKKERKKDISSCFRNKKKIGDRISRRDATISVRQGKKSR